MISHEHGKPPTFCQWHKASDRCQEMTHSLETVGGMKRLLRLMSKECQWLEKWHWSISMTKDGTKSIVDWQKLKNMFLKPPSTLTLPPPSSHTAPPPLLGLASGCIMLFLKILYINQNCTNSKVAHKIVNALARESHNVCWNEMKWKMKWMLILIPTWKKTFRGLTPQVLVHLHKEKEPFYTRTSLLDFNRVHFFLSIPQVSIMTRHT